MNKKPKLIFYVLIATLPIVATLIIMLVSGTGVKPSAPLNQHEASAEQGRYLARAGNCAACHTSSNGEELAGGLEFHTPFGVLYSTNITPDKATGIGEWSFEEFYRSMKAGIRPDGSHLYPAFPYTDFAKMTDEDIASLFLYLQSVEPVVATPPANELDFPFNFRPLLSGWKLLFHETTPFQPDPAQTDSWNRGAYLVEGPGHCGACHTPRNLFGAEQESLAMTGGTHTGEIKRGGQRLWSAANLTADTTGLASWSEEDIVAYLKTGISDQAIVHGPMTEVVMDSTRHLSEADLQAMASYLKSLPAKRLTIDPPPTEEALASGEIIYTVHCGSCHLPTGAGAEGLGVPLGGNALVQAPSPASLINVILYGPHLPPRPFSVDRSNMKMFGKRLSDEDIALIASYVRASFGNQAGAVTVEQVKAQR